LTHVRFANQNDYTAVRAWARDQQWGREGAGCLEQEGPAGRHRRRELQHDGAASRLHVLCLLETGWCGVAGAVQSGGLAGQAASTAATHPRPCGNTADSVVQHNAMQRRKSESLQAKRRRKKLCM
jgi:hypothetical protein